MSMAAPLATHLGTPARLDRLGGGRWWRAAKHALDGASPLAVLSPASGRSMLNGRTVNDNALISRQGGIKYVVGADGVLSAVPANTLAYDWSSGVRDLLLEGQATNKLTCRKANPIDLAGLVKTGDALTTLAVVDDAVALAMAKLSGVCISGKVYKLDNSAGTVEAQVNIDGPSGNTNIHTASAYWRGAGLGEVGVGGLTPTLSAVPTTYQRVSKTSTPVDSAAKWRLKAAAGAVIFFILPEFVEAAAVGSVIPGDTLAAVTRLADVAPLWSAAGTATAWAWRGNVPSAGVALSLLGSTGGHYLRSIGAPPYADLVFEGASGAFAFANGLLPGSVGACLGWGGSGRIGAANQQAAFAGSGSPTYARTTMYAGLSTGLVAGQVLRLRELVAWQLSDRPSAAGCQSQARLWSA